MKLNLFVGVDMSIYKNKKVLLATMHKKEIAVRPPFANIVGCEVVVAEDFNTDSFGTFSGEISRQETAYETLKNKALFAAEKYGFDYVISSEGSFGPHPSNPFVNADMEMLLFYDKTKDLFISDYEISVDTNHAEIFVTSESFNSSQYVKWLNQVKFPSHGLIVKNESMIIKKGISDLVDLNLVIEDSLKQYKTIKLETDMRAMMNPSRMNVIEQLSYKLAKRVAFECIKCSTPGFGNIIKSGNLFCELCFNETNVPKFLDKVCLKCDYLERQEIDPKINFANPRYCDYCNP